MFPCITGKRIPGTELYQWLFEHWPRTAEADGSVSQTVPLDLQVALREYRRLTAEATSSSAPRRASLFPTTSTGSGSSDLPVRRRAPRRLPPLEHRPAAPPIADPEPEVERPVLPVGLGDELREAVGGFRGRRLLAQSAVAKWQAYAAKSKAERAALVGELNAVAREISRELEGSRKFKINARVNAAKRAASTRLPSLPIIGKRPLRESHRARPRRALEENLVLTGLSVDEVLSLASTGRWSVISQNLEMGFTINSAKDALTQAKSVYTETVATVEGAEVAASGATQEAMARMHHSELDELSTEGANYIDEMLKISFRDIEIHAHELIDFRPILERLLGPEILKLIGASIPMLSTVMGTFKGAMEAKKARSAHKGAAHIRSGMGLLRPETPGIAASAVIGSLKLYRNLHIEQSLTHIANAIASLFDGGLVSGPVTGLARIAITVYKLYKAYKELQAYRAAMGLNRPYDALRASGTMGAYVLLHYPVIGLVNSRRLTHDMVHRRTKTVLKFFNKSVPPDIKAPLVKIFDASLIVLKESPLQVGPTGSLAGLWTP